VVGNKEEGKGGRESGRQVTRERRKGWEGRKEEKKKIGREGGKEM